MYALLRQLLFLLPPEEAHAFSMRMLERITHQSVAERFFLNRTHLQGKPYEVFGLKFPNKIGMAAGFDKNAHYLKQLALLGFGHAEIGTVTPMPQPGNEKPRLFRLTSDKALINRMGFNNNGVKAIRGRLEMWRRNTAHTPFENFIVGGNIGKNKNTPNEDAGRDYKICFTELAETVDYFTVNISSSNISGLRQLQTKEGIESIFYPLQEQNAALKNPRPLLLKIAPDLSEEDLFAVVEAALSLRLSGIVISNTTLSREGLRSSAKYTSEAGGLSGKPLFDLSTSTLKKVVRYAGTDIGVIGSGGIMTPEDAVKKTEAGASLIQLYTGFIYAGPSLVKGIHTALEEMG